MAVETRRQPRIQLEELCRLPSFFLPAVSWKRDRVAFYWDKTGRMELHVMDLATKEIRQISHGEVPTALRAGFAWSRDDKSIVFAKDAGGNEQHDLYKIDVATSKVTQLTNDPAAQEYVVQFSPDDTWITVMSNKRHPAAQDKPGQLNLWKMRPDGSEYTPLTRFAFPVFGGIWSPDGTQIAFNTNEDATDLKNTDVYLTNADGSGTKKIFSAKVGSQDGISHWHPDGRRLAITSDASGTPRAGILDIASGQVRWLGKEGVEEHSGRFSEDGRTLVALRNHESQVRPVLYDVTTGAARELKLDPGVSSVIGFYEDDRKLLVGYQSETRRSELASYDLTTDRLETVLAADYGSIDPGAFVAGEHVYYPSFDGKQIPAIVYKPRDIAAGEKLPAIVHVHGGPTGQWFRGFDPFAQFLADRGFVVIEPNIRGSTGYGVPFRDAALKDWGGADLEDVAAATDYLKTQRYVDGSRLVVFGGSYGGFMAFMAAVKKPDLWRAAVAWVGVSDLHKLYAKSMEHFKYYFREQMGDPEKDHALWRDRSAVEFAGQLKAKLLMVHGVNDPRCPVEQSQVFRDRLIELGRKEGEDFEYVELADEGHGSSDIKQKIRTFRILADYLEKVLN
ncbi:MAG TPA: S9 family peptidase [Candidatus Limnocylindrales bacterium]|nr:S9 family peptidase [Candidatus Limnocylindrales bacterium]